MTTTKTRNRFQRGDIRAFIRQNSFVAGATSCVAQKVFIACQGKIGTADYYPFPFSPSIPFSIHSHNYDYAGGTRIFMTRGYCVLEQKKNRKYKINYAEILFYQFLSGRDYLDF